jgi:membrane protein implicated in regulation of membrane protease activity
MLPSSDTVGAAIFFQVYVFALVLGGVLLAASMFAGDSDDGGTADGDLDGGPELGDGDASDAELGEASTDMAHAGEGHGDLGGLVAIFVSLRFWSFFAFVFGLTGVVLDGLALTGSQLLTLGLSLAAGALGGGGASAAIRAATRSEVGQVASASDYVGQTGRVLLPIGGEGPGKLRIVLMGTTVDVLATTDDSEPIGVGETALIVEMQGTVASVTRMNNRNLEDSPS